VIEPIIEELRRRGLAGESTDGVSVPLSYTLRSLVLTLLSQILRARGAERGLDLAPATDRPQLQRSLTDLLYLPSLPSSGHVFSLDAEDVGVDLSAVGLDIGGHPGASGGPDPRFGPAGKDCRSRSTSDREPERRPPRALPELVVIVPTQPFAAL